MGLAFQNVHKRQSTIVIHFIRESDLKICLSLIVDFIDLYN